MADNLQINVVSSQSTPVVMEEKKLVLKILSSVAGAKGDSIYTLAVKHGYTGTEEEFVETYMRSVVDNVYDISASHLVEGQPSEYVDLATALGSGGENIPSDRQLGGMSVKFIESTGHTYVQYRLMKNQFSTNESDWQGIDNEPTAGSNNLVKSGGVYNTPKIMNSSTGSDLDISDENGNVLARFSNGHIKTKNFDSRNNSNVYTAEDISDSNLDISDENGNVILRLQNGHIKTKNFDSSNIEIKDEYEMSTVISDFTNFSGTSWTKTDNKLATTLSSGNSNRFTFGGGSTFEDTFNIGFNIIPEGDVFEMGCGKFYSLAGGMFTICKTSTTSEIKCYNVNNSNGSRGGLHSSIVLSKINFRSGNEYHIEIKKRVYNYDTYFVKIVDLIYGYSEEVEIIGSENPLPFRFWGTIGFYMINGTRMTISNFSFAYQNPEKLQLMISGHSFVEGNSIDGQKEKKYSKLIAKQIGIETVSINGRGGGTTGELSGGIFNEEATLLGKPKYVLFNTGTNDGSDASIISNSESLVTICQNLNIIPIWCTVSPDLRNGINTHDVANAWIKQQPYFLDIQYAFYNEDGTINRNAFLSDNVHPSIETHKKIADMFIAKFGKLFTIKNI